MVVTGTLSRFQVTQGCANLPGRCAVCGSVDGLMVDFGMDLDFYGTVYLCVTNCFAELANRLEYYTPGQVEHIKEQFSELVTHNADLNAHNKELSDAVDSLSKLRIDFESADSSDNDPVLDTSEPKPVLPERKAPRRTSRASNKVVRDGNKKTSEREDRSDESIDESGSSSVHHDDSINELFPDSI